MLLLGVLHGHPVLAAGDISTITVTSSAPTADFGTDVQFTAQVAGVDGPGTGTVDFLIDGVDVAPGVALDSGTGSATFDTTTLSAGTHAVGVAYSGDGDYAAGSGTLSPDQIVDHAPTTTALASDVDPSVVGQPVTLTATVTSPGGIPTSGSIDFKDVSAGPQDLGTVPVSSSGTAAITIVYAQSKDYDIKATYSGNAYFVGSGTPLGHVQLVYPASTEVELTTTASSVTGEPYSVSVSVSVVAPGGGIPVGAVLVDDGTGDTCDIAMPVVPSGSCSLTSATAGEKTITATFLYLWNYASSAASTTHEVDAAATTASVTSDRPQGGVHSQSVTFTATVTAVSPGSGIPTGMVTFMDGANPIGIGLLNGTGQARFTTAALTTATHSITAVYAGDGNYAGVTSPPISQFVGPDGAYITLALSAGTSPSNYGDALTFTATVTPGLGESPPTTVVYFGDSTFFLTAPLDATGHASVTTSTLAIGTHSITASFLGTTDFFGNTSSPLIQVVRKDTPTVTLTSDNNPATYGQYVDFSVSVAGTSGTPTGEVDFMNDGHPLGSAFLNGSGVGKVYWAADSRYGLGGGTHTITAQYFGDATYSGATGTLSGGQENEPAPLTVTAQDATRPYGAPDPVLTAGYGGFVNGEDADTADLTGAPACATTAVPASSVVGGPYPITCAVGTLASNDYAFSFAPGRLTVTRAASTTIVASNHDPSVAGQSVIFTATIGGFGGGSVSGIVDFIVDGGAPQAEPVSGDHATYATAALAAGVHTIEADYDGDANLIGSTGTLASEQAVGVSTFRLAGSDRYATGAAIVTGSYGPDDPFVYVASGANFPDGLAGAAAAAFRHAPLVLLGGQAASISPTVDAELRSVVGPDTHILVLGGPASVSAHLFGSLGGYGASSITRLGGADRYATAIRVSQDAYPGVPVSGSVFIASGLAFPDALSAAGIAGRLGAPLILVPGNLANLNSFPGILTELSRLGPSHVYIAGGTAAVSTGIASQIATLLSVTPMRFAGANRYQTATEMTDFFFGTVSGTPVAPFSGPPVPTVYVASGLDFPDALAGAALAGEHGAPLLLVPGRRLERRRHRRRRPRGHPRGAARAPAAPDRHLRRDRSGLRRHLHRARGHPAQLNPRAGAHARRAALLPPP